MPVSNRNGLIHSFWGYQFEWTNLHQTAQELRPMIFTYDKLADECVARLGEIDPPVAELEAPKRDLFSLLKAHAKNDPKLSQFWAEINTVPEWVEWGQIKRGQEVFFRYGLPILNVLSFQSLLGGMGSGRVVETLARTRSFSVDVVRRRLLETLQYVLQVTISLNSIKPGGDGHVSSVRVRLLHASVRSRIMSLVEEKPEYYDVENFGIPINDLDCMATINTFSTSVIWLGLPRQGIWLREQEMDDFLALWRLVAHYMGAPTDSLATQAQGRAMMETLLASEINPTETGKILAQNIITGLENTPPAYASKQFMEAMARHLNGDQLSDSLGLARPNFYHKVLVHGYFRMLMALAYSFRQFPLADRVLIELRRRLYYAILMDKSYGLGGESVFEFKHLPFHDRITKLGRRKSSRKHHQPAIATIAQLKVLAVVVSITTIFCGIILALKLQGHSGISR